MPRHDGQDVGHDRRGMMVECIGHDGQGVWDTMGEAQQWGMWDVTARACHSL